jgi:hypothetical protein
VHVLDAERLQLAATKPGVERGRVDVVRVTGERLEQSFRLGYGRGALPPRSRFREVEVDRRVDRRLAPPVERLQRDDRVADGLAGEALAVHPFDDRLHVAACDVRDGQVAEFREYKAVEVGPVVTERRRAVRNAAARANFAAFALAAPLRDGVVETLPPLKLDLAARHLRTSIPLPTLRSS